MEIGINAEEVRDEIVGRVAEKLIEHFVSDGDARDAIESSVSGAIDAMVDRVATESVEPMVLEKIEGVVLQKTDEWGEAKGEPFTFRQYLVKRAEAYMMESVDFHGKTNAEARGSSWNHRNTQTRIAFMVDSHLHHEIKSAMESALKNANEVIVGGIQKTVKMKLAEVAKSLKVEVKKGR